MPVSEFLVYWGWTRVFQCPCLAWPQVTHQKLPHELIFQSLAETRGHIVENKSNSSSPLGAVKMCCRMNIWVTPGYHGAYGSCPPDTAAQWTLKQLWIEVSDTTQPSYKWAPALRIPQQKLSCTQHFPVVSPLRPLMFFYWLHWQPAAITETHCFCRLGEDSGKSWPKSLEDIKGEIRNEEIM